jgi:hypothetical protein
MLDPFHDPYFFRWQGIRPICYELRMPNPAFPIYKTTPELVSPIPFNMLPATPEPDV